LLAQNPPELACVVVVVYCTIYQDHFLLADRAAALLALVTIDQLLRGNSPPGTPFRQSPRVFFPILFDSAGVFDSPLAMGVIHASIAAALE
jgi:hypothetical protein